MGYERIKPEHGGAKNGGGAWMARAEAKQTAKRKRRQEEKGAAGGDHAADDWGNIDDFSARGSEPMLQRLDTQEVAAGVSWEPARCVSERGCLGYLLALTAKPPARN